ncbi:16S rRNA (adenine(1518)-N(6)/adenine(1519)-N(6))-dimethyltransferase RsmA [Leptolyngbya sp. FACHB-261]|uniref:16S rRNA (adenine(1518)-N(6)/adenine(1519)-N(6))- dimethyltransferase RsmA n=1 Tax=Leptolyngbya sp. FACHB-261 TaxID=2692806 RepID=UPI001682561E|nr:16S rRNA (adenine(1518)-N(6)/adenine(1519)-N(6))-dimethyltransferase RsmA [Leptolyngbya sp. FACHB-261]MBD2101797.1 16S rRNA (adenine(1518)-N(6)/adenine(1519)-N(6))-dimethyltransferase RsmA [Leptolyngbya sp. FACHB-261]
MSIRPRKRFGQHWLRSEKALASIVAAADLKPTDHVLEIGPGTGSLTQMLLPKCGALTAVELDRDLIAPLLKRFGNLENFQLVEGDILMLPLPSANKVVANIPYNITGPILEKLLGRIATPINQFERIVLLLQKEVALRLCARPGSKHYGALSVKVQYLVDAAWVCDVGAQAFKPPPKVDSAVITLQPHPPRKIANNPQHLEKLVTAGFATRRKMLRNTLGGLVNREQLTSFLEQLEVNPQARAEDLGVDAWVSLSNLLVAAAQDDAPLLPESSRQDQPVSGDCG